jgi:hypothetical protein
MKIGIRVFFENLSRKLEFHDNVTRIRGTTHEDLCTFMILSPRILLRLRRVLGKKKYVEKIEIHILCSIVFFSENRTVYVVMWKNMAEPDTPQMAIWRGRTACWILIDTDTH